MSDLSRTRTTLLATTVAALATSALTVAGPAPASGAPAPSSGHVDVKAPDLVIAGTRPKVKVFVNALQDVSAPAGWVQVVVRKQGGGAAWRVTSRYTGPRMVFRVMPLRNAGRYDVRVRFRASESSGTPSGFARDRIDVYELND